ncbi:MAG: acyl--CoA ligase [Deltaproteobacteria bacterium]|nr:acyl--CoA ligase [Deltaproteobacteria bacterium]
MILAPEQMITEWTDKGAWTEKTLIDYFKEHVAAQPDKICLVDPPNKLDLMSLEAERLTYQELDKAVDATAEAFLNMGITKDDIIMVQMPNCWELAMLYLAITRAGALISPLPMQWRSSELEYIADLTKAAAIITVDDFNRFKHKEMAEAIQSKYPTVKYILTVEDIREMTKGAITGKLDAITIDANDIFTLSWSSGTEAQAKGCPLSHNNWYVQAGLQIESAGIKPGDNLLTAGPLVNMASVGTVYIQWLMLGGKLVLHHPFNPEILFRQFVDEEINYTLLVPAVVNLLLKYPKLDEIDISSVRAVTIGSAPPALWSVQELKKRWGIEFGNIWGQNESTAIISGIYDIPDMEMRIDHFPQFGKPNTKWSSPYSQFIQTKLINPDNGEEITEMGGVGELHYRGPNVIPCYFRRSNITDNAFDDDGYFNTGDLFQIQDNNCIGFFERTKDIIIRGGFNISAQEIENMLLGHPKVLDVAAIAIPDETMGEKTCVYAVPRGEETITLDDLTSFMKEKGIAAYKLPERLEVVKEIPRNPVGKILKKVLREDIKEKLNS